MADIPPTSRRLTMTGSKSKKSKTQTTKERGYGSEWEKVRDWKIRNYPVCEFKFVGCTGFAEAVHHSDQNPHNNSPDNLVSVCRHCHQLHHSK